MFFLNILLLQVMRIPSILFQPWVANITRHEEENQVRMRLNFGFYSCHNHHYAYHDIIRMILSDRVSMSSQSQSGQMSPQTRRILSRYPNCLSRLTKTKITTKTPQTKTKPKTMTIKMTNTTNVFLDTIDTIKVSKL